MRSRGVVARRLVVMKCIDEAASAVGAALTVGEETVGHVTSAGFSPANGSTMVMGYVRTAHADPGVVITAQSGPHRSPCVVLRIPGNE